MKELVFLKPSGSSLPLQLVDLKPIKKDDRLSECRLIVRLSASLYQQIETELLFNLKQELRGSLNALKFDDDADIEIEATLQPQLLSQFSDDTTDSETAIAHLIACSQSSEAAEHPLLSTESWFALKVKQERESGNEISYCTFWSYLNPTSLTPAAIASGQFSDAMEQFLKDRNEANVAFAEKALSTAFDEISNDLKNWDETAFLKQAETAISDFFSGVTQALETWEPNLSSSKLNPHTKGRIYQAMLQFFSEEDWEFTKLRGKPTLRLACQGQNGQWNCFALANENQQRFSFYSICPLEIPAPHRSAIAEFLTRANYGMEIGNFELDFDSGDVRCKTSIDVEGDRLTSALIKQLVYTNVITMDCYLPGIEAIVEGRLSPVEAIAQIENQTEPSTTDPQPEPVL